MHQSAEELIMFFQSDLMSDFGFDDEYAIQSLVVSMQELRRMKLELPAAPRPGDAVEKPTKPFGSFEPPSVEQFIASMQVDARDGAFVGRPSIPADGGPVIIPEALMKRNASDWSFLDRENDEVSSCQVSVAATDCPSSRTSLVSSLLDNIGSVPTTANESGIVSFTAAEWAVSSRTTLTDQIAGADQISNSEYDNVPAGGCDEFSSVYEKELEQTLESIEQEIQELLGVHGDSDRRIETVSSADTHNDCLHSMSTSVTASEQQNHLIGSQNHLMDSQNHLVDSHVCHSPCSESSTKVGGVSPSTAVAGAPLSAPVTSFSDSNSSQLSRNTDDIVVIPIQHLPSTAPCRPPVKPKPKNVTMSPNAKPQSPASALTPIPVLHLRSVPIAQFSSISATKRPVPTSSTNGC